MKWFEKKAILFSMFIQICSGPIPDIEVHQSKIFK